MGKLSAIDWPDLKAKVGTLIPEGLCQAIDERASESDRASLKILEGSFEFGEIIVNDGAVIDPELSAYVGADSLIPFGIVTRGALEVFERRADQGAQYAGLNPTTSPLRILGPGDALGLFETLNDLFGVRPTWISPWSISAGLRSFWLLTSDQYLNVRKAFPAAAATEPITRGKKATDVRDVGELLRDLAREKGTLWRAEIAFFSRSWAKQKDDSTSGQLKMARELATLGWRQAQYYIERGYTDGLLADWAASAVTAKSRLEKARALLAEIMMVQRGDRPGFAPWKLIMDRHGRHSYVDPVGELLPSLRLKTGYLLAPAYLTFGNKGAYEVFIPVGGEKDPAAGSFVNDVNSISYELKSLEASLGYGSIAGIALGGGPGKRIFPIIQHPAQREAAKGIEIPLSPTAGEDADKPLAKVAIDAQLEAPCVNLMLRPLLAFAEVAGSPIDAKSTIATLTGATAKKGGNSKKLVGGGSSFLKAALKLQAPNYDAPVLDYVVTKMWRDIRPTLNIAIVIHHHLLPSVLPLLHRLLLLVRHPRQIFILGKAYSTVPWVEAHIANLGFNVFPDKQQRDVPIGQYEQGIRANLQSLWAFVDEQWGEHERYCATEDAGLSRVLAYDDGGRLAVCVPHAMRAKVKEIVAIEQTTSGSNQLEKAWLPVVDVGRSAAKREFESSVIVEGILGALSAHGVVLGKSNTVGVLGYGYIGRHLARALKERAGKVLVFDTSETVSLVDEGLVRSQSAAAVLQSCDVVFGCAGVPVVDVRDITEIAREETILVSCSSGDVEFSKLLVELFPDATSSLEDLHVQLQHQGNSKKPILRILNGGFPVNFCRSHEHEAYEAIMLTRALSLGAICAANTLASKSKRPTGTIMLDPSLQYEICRWHHAHYSVPPINAAETENWFRDTSQGTAL